MDGMGLCMSNKILFCTGEGIGNVIQTIPVIRTLKEVLGVKVDLWYAFGTFKLPKIIPYVDKWIVGGQIKKTDMNQYVGAVSTKWTIHHIKNLPIPILNKITDLSMTRSEVDCYMDIARNLKVSEEDLLWWGECNYKKSDEFYDVVIHNGYNFKGSSDWKLKSYPRYKEVVKLLGKDISLCSVGSKSEHIKGTIDRTGLNVLDSLGIVKNAKVFLGNDSGLYHCANALDVPNLVIFTYTSTEKNYDKRFHRKAQIICREDLKCRWCQCAPRFKTCETRECRNIDPKIIVDAVLEKLYG
jgi:ADP-heptose:LPS heptosyltransferase